MSDDAQTIRECLTYGSENALDAGMAQAHTFALAALDRLVRERDEAREALREAWEHLASGGVKDAARLIEAALVSAALADREAT